MAEKLKARLRVKKIEFADPITKAADYDKARFSEMPYTLQDDTLSLLQDDLEEDNIYVNEVDAPIDTEYTGGVSRFSGAFVEPTVEQLKTLVGNVESEGFAWAHGAKAFTIKKAILVTCVDDSLILLPNASGYVKIDHGLNNKTGRRKYPFKFTANAASTEWPVDQAKPTKRPTASPGK